MRNFTLFFMLFGFATLASSLNLYGVNTKEPYAGTTTNPENLIISDIQFLTPAYLNGFMKVSCHVKNEGTMFDFALECIVANESGKFLSGAADGIELKIAPNEETDVIVNVNITDVFNTGMTDWKLSFGYFDPEFNWIPISEWVDIKVMNRPPTQIVVENIKWNDDEHIISTPEDVDLNITFKCEQGYYSYRIFAGLTYDGNGNQIGYYNRQPPVLYLQEGEEYSYNENYDLTSLKEDFSQNEIVLKENLRYYYYINAQQTFEGGEAEMVQIYEGYIVLGEEIPVLQLYLETDEITMTEYEYASLNVVVSPENASDITYIATSSNPDIVEISDGGKTLYAYKPGESIITVTSPYGLTDSCKVIVKPLSNVDEIISSPISFEYFNLQGFRIHNPEKEQILIRKSSDGMQKIKF